MDKSIITITNNLRQEIEGFGVSGAWWAQEIGGWNDNNRRKILELLFHKDKGIGNSIFRYNIGAGSGEEIKDNWRRAETFEIGKSNYDWQKDANAILVLKEVHKMGVNNFVAFANSPTARMTKSGCVCGHIDGEANLSEDMYEDFAQYLIDIVQHLREVQGIPIEWLSSINEPHWDWNIKKGQEGCHYSSDECIAFLKVLNRKMKVCHCKFKLAAIEAGHWNSAVEYMDKILNDKELQGQLTHFDIHSYFSDIEDKKKTTEYVRKKYPNIKLRMTEWTEMQEGRDYGIESALTLANTIHEDLTIPEVTSWQYWIAVSKYDYRDGLIYTNEGTQDIEETKRLWAMGNYSKFIRQGAIRLDSICSSHNIKASVFLDKERYIIVIVNNGEEIEVDFQLEHIRNITNMDIYETSNSKDLERVFSGKYNSKINISSRSITTVILN